MSDQSEFGSMNVDKGSLLVELLLELKEIGLKMEVNANIQTIVMKLEELCPGYSFRSEIERRALI